MDAKQRLYYALGQVAYAVAKVDGRVQKEEEKKLHEIILNEMKQLGPDLDYSEIIFDILKKDQADFDAVYSWAINEIHTCSYKLDDELKNKFVRIVEKVAEAFPPVTKEEELLVRRFREDMEIIKEAEKS